MEHASLPSRQDICQLEDNLDGRLAAEHFAGKDLSQAEDMFCADRGCGQYWDDLMYIGAVAFQFYIRAAINYLTGQTAEGDYSAALAFALCIEHRIEFAPEELVPVAEEVSRALLHIRDAVNSCAMAVEGLQPDLVDVVRGRVWTLYRK